MRAYADVLFLLLYESNAGPMSWRQECVGRMCDSLIARKGRRALRGSIDRSKFQVCICVCNVRGTLVGVCVLCVYF